MPVSPGRIDALSRSRSRTPRQVQIQRVWTHVQAEEEALRHEEESLYEEQRRMEVAEQMCKHVGGTTHVPAHPPLFILTLRPPLRRCTIWIP